MVKRVPIKITRKPIIIPDHLKGQLKLWELTEETKEEDIIELAEHYNMLMMDATKKAGYTALPYKNPTEHKNWIHFESIYEICRIKGWDGKLYIEGQFERAKHWTKMKHPLPSMMYSVKAIKFHINFMGNIKVRYKKDTGKAKKEKGKETKILRDIIIENTISSAETLATYMARAKNKAESEGQHKALSIFNHWHELSPYYLWSVPWFHDVIKDLSGKKVDECMAEFDRISKSPMIKRTIEETVPQTEEHFKLPANIEF